MRAALAACALALTSALASCVSPSAAWDEAAGAECAREVDMEVRRACETRADEIRRARD